MALDMIGSPDCKTARRAQNLDMTLIITAMSPYRVVQVSDRRLTLPGGRLYDDEAIKAVTVHCNDAYFSVAYTGLAQVRGKRTRKWERTDEWIARSLHDLMQQPGLKRKWRWYDLLLSQPP